MEISISGSIKILDNNFYLVAIVYESAGSFGFHWRHRDERTAMVSNLWALPALQSSWGDFVGVRVGSEVSLPHSQDPERASLCVAPAANRQYRTHVTFGNHRYTSAPRRPAASRDLTNEGNCEKWIGEEWSTGSVIRNTIPRFTLDAFDPLRVLWQLEFIFVFFVPV